MNFALLGQSTPFFFKEEKMSQVYQFLQISYFIFVILPSPLTLNHVPG